MYNKILSGSAAQILAALLNVKGEDDGREIL